MKIITTVTEDLVNLSGILYDFSYDKDSFILIPGIGGNYVDNSFITYLGQTMQKHEFNFLGANTRGSYAINYSFLPNSKLPPKKIGTAFEKFNECIYDIDSWINTLTNMGFSNISLIGHSFGCNKIIYYMNYGKYSDLIKQIILISPSDTYHVFNNKKYYLEKCSYATKMINQGKSEQLIEYSFFYKTCENLLLFLNDNNYDNFPIFSKNQNKLNQLQHIHSLLSIIVGELETDITDNLKFLTENLISFDTYIIPNAQHSYKDVENILANNVVEIAKQKVLRR